MKTKLHALIFLAILFLSIQVQAQFEQKLTVNAAVSLTYPDMMSDITSFGMGYGLEGGLMFNLNRSVSVFGSTRFYYMFGGSDAEDAYYDNLSIGGGLKFNLLPSKRLNPYILGEANVNMIWLEEYIHDISGGYYDGDFGTSIGGYGGLGLDFKLNENFSVFGQSAVFYTLWDGRTNLYSLIGLRINMIKSKTI